MNSIDTTAPERSTFYLKGWCIQPGQLRMTAPDGTSHSVEPRMMDVLLCLADAPNEVVTRETLMEVVWKDCIVVDDTLNRCVSQLRKLLRDRPEQPQFIETIRSKGYRLLVTPAAKEPLVVDRHPVSRIPKHLKWPAIAACASLLVFWAGWKAGFNTLTEQQATNPVAGLPPLFITDDAEIHSLPLPEDGNVFYFSQNDTSMKWVNDPSNPAPVGEIQP